MFQTLRILFTILSAICIAVVIPVGAIGGFVWAVLCAVAAFVFFLIMLYFKRKQEELDPENQNPQPDFFSPEQKNEQNDEQSREPNDK